MLIIILLMVFGGYWAIVNYISGPIAAMLHGIGAAKYVSDISN